MGKTEGWKLKRTSQCAHCPWIKGSDPLKIPNGYSLEKHKALAGTIAKPGDLSGLKAKEQHVFACHETDDAHCVGWVSNQLGHGNSLRLRIEMMTCENIGALRLRGEQHRSFEDTLPRVKEGAS